MLENFVRLAIYLHLYFSRLKLALKNIFVLKNIIFALKNLRIVPLLPPTLGCFHRLF